MNVRELQALLVDFFNDLLDGDVVVVETDRVDNHVLVMFESGESFRLTVEAMA